VDCWQCQTAVTPILDRVDYVETAVMLAVPTSMVLTILVVEFAPGELLRGFVEPVL